MFRLHLPENPADDLDELLYHILNPPQWGLDGIDAAVRTGIADNFAGERSEAGPWAQLAPSTQLDRILHGYGAGHPILVRKGDYRNAFIAPGGQHSVQFERTAEGWRVSVGSDDRRVPWLEGGTSRIPARPATLLERGAEERIGRAIDAIMRAV